jgi:lipoyl(octanoyl) transferase
MTLVEDIVVKELGRVAYEPTWETMRAFTRNRDDSTPDELWFLEHAPVYTVGQGAVIPPVTNGVRVVKTDRGGDITYHGPGQVVVYTLRRPRPALDQGKALRLAARAGGDRPARRPRGA